MNSAQQHTVLHLRTPAGVVDVEVPRTDLPLQERFAARLDALWAHLCAAPPTAGAERSTAADAVRLTEISPSGEGSAEEELLVGSAAYSASGRITLAILQRLVGTRLLLHSGAIDHPEHGLMLLIGASGAGKSTATTALAQGGGYLSDELAVIDAETLQVTPYPKPISRVRAPAHPGPSTSQGSRVKVDHTLAEMGLGTTRADLAPTEGGPRHVLLLSRRSAPGPARLRRIGLLEAVPRIIEQSSSIWTLPDPLGTLARLLTEAGGALEAVYTESAELTAALEVAPPPLREQWSVITREADRSSSGTSHRADDDRFGVGEWTQALEVDGALVVLREERVVALSGIAALMWDILRADGPLTKDQLFGAVIEAIGDHPEADALLTAAHADLIASSLLH